MRNLNLLILVLALTLGGCKTQKIAPKPQPIAEETTTTAAPAPVANIPKQVKPVNVASKEERFSVANGETADYGSNKFFIIMGSFGVMENAKRLKETLASENFHPVILVNESGMYRVCSESFAEEAAARSKIAEVREKFPTKYNDIWLLIKKQ